MQSFEVGEPVGPAQSEDKFVIQLWPLLLIGLAPLATGLFLNPSRADWDNRIALASTLLCALCFALTFFWQELWLVLPKAMTPGLDPTLYHNDHTWRGSDPIAELLQGTGALSTLAIGLTFLVILMRAHIASVTMSLFFFWMAFQGLFQALTQVVIGTLLSGNDFGRALAYLGAEDAAKFALFVCAVGAMWFFGRILTRFYPLARAPGAPRSRGFAFVIFIPALLSIGLIIPFRLPREIIEVVLIPVIVNVTGASWVIAGAIRARDAGNITFTEIPRLAGPAVAVGSLLFFFQLVLRPGIEF